MPVCLSQGLVGTLRYATVRGAPPAGGYGLLMAYKLLPGAAAMAPAEPGRTCCPWSVLAWCLLR